MRKVVLVAALVWVSVGMAVSAGVAQAPSAVGAAPSVPSSTPTPATAPHQALLNRYCVTCHNARLGLPAGQPLYLDSVNINDPAKDAATWEKVLHKLGVGAMPPQGSPRPDPAALGAFTAYVASSLDRAAAANNNPGRFVLHRLNRTEYANAIRDLLGVEVDVTALLPPDSAEFGFDNIASGLKVTPSLLERYLTAALRITALAAGDPKVESADARFPVRLDLTQDNHIEGLPLGTRGGILVRYTFPADGEYLLSGRLFRPIDNSDSGIEGHETPHQFVITIDGATVHTGSIGGVEDHDFSGLNLAGARDAVAERMKTRLAVTAGPHDVGFTFVERPARSQDTFEPAPRSSQDLHMGSGLAKLGSVTISGPFNVTGVGDTPSRGRLFVCKPTAATETRCAREILSTVARRAYRRPIADEDLLPVMAFYEFGRKDADFESGIRAALPRILASPLFLFRSEQDPASLPAGAAHPVTDLELASRLSFFLWSSIPDDELLDLAIRGRLRAPGVLAQQVRRMLVDERSNALANNFSDQWLALRNLEKVTFDLLAFGEWDHNLRAGMRRETQLFFGSTVREDRSALDLLNADYTFVDEQLARHYGIPNVYGSRFRRVTLTDPNRRGLLGQGSILALTSVATRTSPVFRGKWILTNLLDLPPLPPPDDVPALEENTGAARPKSVRERLEAHRANPVCASCHKNMDPIGFALEGFNPVGQWRSTTEAGTPVDASGVFLDGSAIDGPVALRRALTSHPDAFVGTVTEKLLTYALGRGLEPYDKPVVRGILRDAARNDYRFMSIITGIVQSRPFQMRVKLAAAEP